ESRVVGVVVLEREDEYSRVHGIGLVGGVNPLLGAWRLCNHRAGDASVWLSRSPAAHGFLQYLSTFRRVKGTADCQCAMAGAKIFVVKHADLVERHSLDAFDLFLDGRDVTYIVFGIHRKQVGECTRGECRRFGPHLFETGQTLALEDLELPCWQRGLAQDLAEQVEHGREIGMYGLD